MSSLERINQYSDSRAYGWLMQFARRYDDDATVNEVVEVELTDTADGMIEFCFEVRPSKQRTYIRLRVSDIRRFLKQCTP